jgi:mono/diheme cytochrome c family protein
MQRQTLVMLRIFKPCGAPALAALALGACAALQHPSDQPATRGHAVARRECAACHAIEPGSLSPRRDAPPFAGPGLRHTASLDGRVAELARLGHYDMPPLKLTTEEARDVAAYIESLGPP